MYNDIIFYNVVYFLLNYKVGVAIVLDIYLITNIYPYIRQQGFLNCGSGAKTGQQEPFYWDWNIHINNHVFNMGFSVMRA